jgi:hypothetical protein
MILFSSASSLIDVITSLSHQSGQHRCRLGFTAQWLQQMGQNVSYTENTTMHRVMPAAVVTLQA